MWNDEDEDSNGSTTPPLPVRAPAPPPPAFIRSHSLGKTESKMSFHGQEEAQLNMLAGRHTHHYPVSKESEQLEFSKADFEELQARCAQMEKTMRWWSECTANWRDKWSKVRAERNKYKDDLKRLSLKHEATIEELNRRQLEMPDNVSLTHKEVQTVKSSAKEIGINTDNLDLSVTSHSLDFDLVPPTSSRHHQDDDSGVFQVKGSNFSPSSDRMSRFLSDVSALQSAEQSTMTSFRLEEAVKTIEAERKEKDLLTEEIESLNSQITTLNGKCDELTLVRSDLTKDMESLRIDFTDQIREYARQLDDSVSAKHNLEQVIGHLREEIERLQAENADEWGRRERLETEKQSIERQFKQLKNYNDDLKSRLEKLAAHNNLQASNEMAKLKADVEKHKTDLAEMKHLNSKLKKNLGDKAEELHHCQRKGDNSDKEVRSLRLRIEQLKQELGEAQDDIDSTTTTIRRLERTNEELSSQCEGLQVQVEHLTSRLRSMPNDLAFRRISRVSAPGGLTSASYSMIHEQDLMEDTSTDENEFNYTGDDEVNETDV